MSALRMLEAEREIPMDRLIPTIEQALLMAYHRTPGALKRARVEIDRATGHVTVWATELDEDDTPIGEFDDTPNGFGRVAASTARQVMIQRMREEDDDKVLGEFKDKEGELVSGVIQQGRNPDDVMVDLGKVEALLPLGERVPGETVAGYIARRTGCAEATREMDASAEALADPDVTDAAADRYNTALTRWLASGAADLEERIPAVLADLGLDLSASPEQVLMTSLSGGQAARVGLAALLLSRRSATGEARDLVLDALDGGGDPIDGRR